MAFKSKLFRSLSILSILCLQIYGTKAEIIGTDSGPQVELKNGVLRGRWQLSRDTEISPTRLFASFEGIPYAKIPDRFESPEPPTDWTGIRDSTFPRSFCPQKDTGSNLYVNETEDCLFANVYVPYSPETPFVPVMLWIHGGGFQVGAGSIYGPKYLMEQDVILVTINYRLGALGFLNTGDDVVPGNMGIKDIIMALRWVQNNIEEFGGDPGSVTIIGQSAGAVAVNLLMISPAAEGLFHKAIAQSGSVLPNWSFNDDPRRLAVKFSNELNCPNATTWEIVECLKTKSTGEILDAQEIVNAASSFGLTVDTNARDFSVLPDTPINVLKNPRNDSNARIPFITGWTLQENLAPSAAELQNPQKLKQWNENWASQISLWLLNYENDKRFVRDLDHLNRVANDIRNFYLNGTSEITINDLQNFSNMFDDYFVKELKRTALIQARYNDQVFPYVFTYRGNYSEANAYGLLSESDGPVHFDEIQYLFNSQYEDKELWPELTPGSADEEFSIKLIELWTSFAKYGYPSPSLDNLRQRDLWLPISSAELNNSISPSTPLRLYNINSVNKNAYESEDVLKRFAFWESLLPNE